VPASLSWGAGDPDGQSRCSSARQGQPAHQPPEGHRCPFGEQTAERPPPLPAGRVSLVAKQKILLVDDDEQLCRELTDLLNIEGFETAAVVNGEDGLTQLREWEPDLVLLDIMLPEMDGLAVLREVRVETNVPVIMLTAKDNEVDRVVGLELGADDYVTKPFSPRELVARVRAMLRRAAVIRKAATRQNTLSFPGLEVDLPTRTVVVDGDPVHLTPKEFDLLYHLASQPRHVFSREDILEQVWGYHARGSDLRTVDTHVKRLRKKLEEGRDHPWSMATVWGVGYKFDTGP